MKKSEALVRDVAKLFLKYNLEDWRLFLEVLRKGSPDHDAICRTIEEIASKRGKPSEDIKKRPSRAKKRLSREASRLPKDIDEKRGLFLSKVEGEITSKSSQWSLAEVRNIYLRSGGKDPLPAKKRDAVRALILHFARLPDDVFVKDVQGILDRSVDLQEDYSKWVKMIYGSAIGVGDQTERTVPKASQVNAAITDQLEDRIRGAVLNNRFRLIYNPLTGASKDMTFLADGIIGEGRNSNEFTWRAVDGRLELLEQKGAIHSRFVLASDGGFNHTNEPDTQSIRDQRLLPVSPLRGRPK